jgi:uncharacterized spore protein YtfJ
MGDHMSTKELVDAAVEHLHTRAGVKTVYGEPVVVDGKTIIPVAKVAYGFDGGSGSKKARAGEAGKEAPARTGEGVGGGVAAKPMGVVEVTDEETKFVAFGQTKKLAWAAALGSAFGVLVGLLLGGRRKG